MHEAQPSPISEAVTTCMGTNDLNHGTWLSQTQPLLFKTLGFMSCT